MTDSNSKLLAAGWAVLRSFSSNDDTISIDRKFFPHHTEACQVVFRLGTRLDCLLFPYGGWGWAPPTKPDELVAPVGSGVGT